MATARCWRCGNPMLPERPACPNSDIGALCMSEGPPVPPRHRPVATQQRSDLADRLGLQYGARQMASLRGDRGGVEIADFYLQQVASEHWHDIIAALRYVDRFETLRDAAMALVIAVEMDQHNDAITRGKKGKAWNGNFVREEIQKSMDCVRASLRALSPPVRGTTTDIDTRPGQKR